MNLTRQDEKDFLQFVDLILFLSWMSKGYMNEVRSKTRAFKWTTAEKAATGIHSSYNTISERLTFRCSQLNKH